MQPDTIIPDLSNPQSWNRYSYVTNRPIVASDPTGHYCVGEVEECIAHDDIDEGGTGDGYQPPDLDDELSGVDGTSGNDETNNPLIDIFDYYNYGLNETMDGCNPFNPNEISAFWNDAACLDVAANFTQDMATLFSTTGASVTLFTTIAACVPASELGGCWVGYVFGVGIYQVYFNPYETIFSGASTFMTIRSDLLTHDTYFNSINDWQIGEDTKTAVGTSLIGGLTLEPFIDAGIDIYASGYNHGYFCGVSTILDCLGR